MYESIALIYSLLYLATLMHRSTVAVAQVYFLWTVHGRVMKVLYANLIYTPAQPW